MTLQDLINFARTDGLALVISVVVIGGAIAVASFLRREAWPRVLGFLDGLISKLHGIEATTTAIKADVLELRTDLNETRKRIDDHLLWRGQERREQQQSHTRQAPTGGGK